MGWLDPAWSWTRSFISFARSSFGKLCYPLKKNSSLSRERLACIQQPSSSCCGLLCTAKIALAFSALPQGWWGLVHVSHLWVLSPSSRHFYDVQQLPLFWNGGSADWMFAHRWMETTSSFALEQWAARSLQPSEFPQGSIYLWRDPIHSFLPFLCPQPLPFWFKPLYCRKAQRL